VGSGLSIFEITVDVIQGGMSLFILVALNVLIDLVF